MHFQTKEANVNLGDLYTRNLQQLVLHLAGTILLCH